MQLLLYHRAIVLEVPLRNSQKVSPIRLGQVRVVLEPKDQQILDMFLLRHAEDAFQERVLESREPPFKFLK
jgi:hypothetical protein